MCVFLVCVCFWCTAAWGFSDETQPPWWLVLALTGDGCQSRYWEASVMCSCWCLCCCCCCCCYCSSPSGSLHEGERGVRGRWCHGRGCESGCEFWSSVVELLVLVLTSPAWWWSSAAEKAPWWKLEQERASVPGGIQTVGESLLGLLQEVSWDQHGYSGIAVCGHSLYVVLAVVASQGCV